MYKVLFSHLQIKTLHKSLLTAYKHACQARHDLHVNHSENDPLAQKEPLGLIFSAAGHQWITSVYQPILVDFEPRWCFATLCADSHTPSHQASSNPARAWDWHGTLSPWLSGNIFRENMGKNQWNINHLWMLGAATCYQPWVGINAFWHFAPRGDSQIPIPMLSSLIPSLVPPRRVWWGGGGKFHGCYCLEDLRMLN